MNVYGYSGREVVTDLVGLVGVVVPLVAVYYLVPAGVQEQLVLDYRSPTVTDVFASTYLHNPGPGAIHLWGNVLSFLLVALPAWWLHLLTGRRRQFWMVMTAILFVFPVFVSAGSYAWFTYVLDASSVTTRGFSGVVGAVAGYLIISVLFHVATIREEDLLRSLSGVIVSAVTATLLVVNADQFVPVLVVVRDVVPPSALAATALGTVYTTRRLHVVEPRSMAAWGERNPGEAAAVVVGTVAFVAVFMAAFPSNPAPSGPVVNVVAHGTGVLLGVLTCAVVESFEAPSRRRSRTASA